MTKQPIPGPHPQLQPGQTNFGVAMNHDTGQHIVICESLVVAPFQFGQDLRDFLRMIKGSFPFIWEEISREIITLPRQPLLGPDGEAIGGGGSE